jgi:MoxR-like ATPase
MSEENEPNETHSYNRFLPWTQEAPSGAEEEFRGNTREGNVYLQNAELQLVAEIAIVTGRPLLLRGEPGSGKSSFAPFAARNLNWRYYEFNVTGRTEAKDMLWRFDALRRLRDAQAAKSDSGSVNSRNYITPGVLWWAFNYPHALQFIKENINVDKDAPLTQIKEFDPFAGINSARSAHGTVVLIDEIDKADPNVPNDLLEVIGMNSFRIDETGDLVKRENFVPKTVPEKPDDYGNLLLVITTNEERDLPPAFLRRCIVHHLEEPTDKEKLVERWTQIAKLHAGNNIKEHLQGEEMVKNLAEKCWNLREQTADEIRRSPSIAEFLDALKTCFRLKMTPDSEIWNQVERSVLVKGRAQNVQ